MPKDLSLSNMRSHYNMGELLESEAHENPFTQFNRWMQDAVIDNLFEPNAMSLATVDENGQPSCRTVLLKGVLEEGFVFYTNYDSKKGRQINVNKKAALLFWWREHERQVRIEGQVIKLPRELSVDYFKERPKGSRISAIISPQSSILAKREDLDDLFAETTEKYLHSDPECPDFWGGYIVQPELFEFWQGRPNRLHDRLQYKLSGNAEEISWKIERLAP